MPSAVGLAGFGGHALLAAALGTLFVSALCLYLAASACVSAMAFLALHTCVQSTLAWNLTVFVAMVAIVGVLPALPSGNSNASVFARERLPENESFESRASCATDQLVRKYALTPREGEVLQLLLQGKTRQEIAKLLVLSTWTVKEHIANIYEKTGVHSSKKLMALVGDQGSA